MARAALLVLAMLVGAPGALAGPREDCAKLSGDEAIEACTTALRMNPRDSQSFYNRALEYRAKGQNDLALADYTKAIEINPRDPDYFNNRGLVYRAKKDVARALADFDRAIQINPNHSNAYNNRGIMFNERGLENADLSDQDRALADYNRAIEIKPSDADYYNNRGNAYRAKAEFERAIVDYNRAIEIDPQVRNTHKNRGYALFNLGAYADAAADFQRSLEKADDAYAMMYRYLSRARMGQSAASELEANATRLKSKGWPFVVIEMLSGKREPDATLPSASDSEEVCEANFYIGQWYLLKGDAVQAGNYFRAATADICRRVTPEYPSAVVELRRLP